MELVPKSMRRRLGDRLFYSTSDRGRFVDMVKFMGVWVEPKFWLFIGWNNPCGSEYRIVQQRLLTHRCEPA